MDASEDPGAERRLSAIVFSDIVGYSKKMGEDEQATVRLVQEHNELLVPIIQRHRGRLLKFIGDAIMSSFASASDAVLCGVEIQRAVAERNQGRPEKARFLLRIGIHIGDVTEKGGEIFGDGVNIAARIQPLADPGGICISQTVYDIVRARSEIRLVSLGARELKNIKESVRIYKVDLGDGAPAPRRSRPRWAAAAVAAALVAAAGWWGVRRALDGAVSAAQAVAPQPPATHSAQRPAEAPSVQADGARPIAPPAGPAMRASAEAAATPHLDLAWKSYCDRQPEEALEALAKARESPRARELRGLVYDYQRRYVEAAAEYLAAAEAFAADGEASVCRLLRYLSLKRAGRDADADLAAYVEKGPHRWPMPVARYLLGKITEERLDARAREAGAAAKRRPFAYYVGMRHLLELESASVDGRARELLGRARQRLQEAASPEGAGSLEQQRAAFELERMRARGDL